MTKISICTINGGGPQTMLRLANSMGNVFRQLEGDYDWHWTILLQGTHGADDRVINTIRRFNRKITFLRYPRNLGTVWAWNELIDWSRIQLDCDYLAMIDDDMVINNHRIIQHLMIPHHEEGDKIATSADRVCYFGNKDDLPNKYNRVGDHGSGCTIYSKAVFQSCGYHNEMIVQYAHDTDFNNRIKMAFGEDCLRVARDPCCTHHNQTGTRNCFPPVVWEQMVKRDSKFIETVNYNGDPYVGRSFFKQPLWTLDFATKI